MSMMIQNDKPDKSNNPNDRILEIIVTVFVAVIILGLMIKIVFF